MDWETYNLTIKKDLNPALVESFFSALAESCNLQSNSPKKPADYSYHRESGALYFHTGRTFWERAAFMPPSQFGNPFEAQAPEIHAALGQCEMIEDDLGKFLVLMDWVDLGTLGTIHGADPDGTYESEYPY